MTVTELATALQAALDRGLPPETTVVVNMPEEILALGDYLTVAGTGDPSEGEQDGKPYFDLWFTLTLGEQADSRFTPGGMP